ncbi:type II toxin-antitoxin system Phd/YefM family antitoxin [Candidatus Thiosymbion oneisti]|uniref:type II toxin-antitoxin system Phd/YefM family antitoxin n=1 Tax=Candidatus Thiosymbion oneisti TaxID=589554 RepID=UPI001C4044D5|nr:type II toxin-antitoxin system prevent-host-death family antitoxin [Candidatus Thiosymbion oneisti]
MTVTISRLRNTLKHTCDQVCNEHQPVFVQRKNGADVVLLSAEDYNSMQETFHLMRSPANAQRILQSLADHSNDKTFPTLDALKAYLNLVKQRS